MSEVTALLLHQQRYLTFTSLSLEHCHTAICLIFTSCMQHVMLFHTYPSSNRYCLKVELITMVIFLPHAQLYVPICQSSSSFAILETSGCGKVELMKMLKKNILALGGHRHPRHQTGPWLPCKQLTAKSQPHGEWSANVPKRVYFM